MKQINTVAIGSLLDDAQLAAVERIVSKIRSRELPTVALRAYLYTQSESLEAKGVLPAYLYYALCLHLELV